MAIVAIGVGLLAIIVGFFHTYGNHDRIDLIDEPHVAATVERACGAMTQRLRSLGSPVSTAPRDRATLIRQQDEAVRQMVARVRALGEKRLRNDLPIVAWLRDWERLAALRDQYAAALLARHPASFTIPQVEGHPIVERMSDAGSPANCTVPGQLTTVP